MWHVQKTANANGILLLLLESRNNAIKKFGFLRERPRPQKLHKLCPSLRPRLQTARQICECGRIHTSLDQTRIKTKVEI